MSWQLPPRRSHDDALEAAFDDGAYDDILAAIRRFGRFDALGYDLLPANFTNHQLEPKTAYIARRQAAANRYAARYRRKLGIPVRPKQGESPAVKHAFRVMIDRSRITIERYPRVKIERHPRVLIELN
jgi:hypothetical protein